MYKENLKFEIENFLKGCETEDKIATLTRWIFKDLKDLQMQKNDFSRIKNYATNLVVYIEIREDLIKKLDTERGQK